MQTLKTGLVVLMLVAVLTVPSFAITDCVLDKPHEISAALPDGWPSGGGGEVPSSITSPQSTCGEYVDCYWNSVDHYNGRSNLRQDLVQEINTQFVTNEKKFGTGSLFLDANDDALKYTFGPNVMLSNGTIEAWIRPTNFDAERTLFTILDKAGYGVGAVRIAQTTGDITDIHCYPKAGSPPFECKPLTVWNIDPNTETPIIKPNQWSHIYISWGQNGRYLEISDGNLNGNNAFNYADSDERRLGFYTNNGDPHLGNILIGRNPGSTGKPSFRGLVDEFRVSAISEFFSTILYPCVSDPKILSPAEKSTPSGYLTWVDNKPAFPVTVSFSSQATECKYRILDKERVALDWTTIPCSTSPTPITVTFGSSGMCKNIGYFCQVDVRSKVSNGVVGIVSRAFDIHPVSSLSYFPQNPKAGDSVTITASYSDTQPINSMQLTYTPAGSNSIYVSGSWAGSPTQTKLMSYTIRNVVPGTYSFDSTVNYPTHIGTGNAKRTFIVVPNAPPVVTQFIITPTTATSRQISINTFTASDDSGTVAGYALTESPTVPTSGWTSTAPTQFTFTSDGPKTLYAWAKDATGLVSTSKSDSILVDTTNPTISVTSPPTQVPTSPITLSGNAADNIGLSRIEISNTNKPVITIQMNGASSGPWSSSLVQLNPGSNTITVKAVDLAGRIATKTVPVTLQSADTTKPIVTAFDIPATTTSLTVQITTFTATDNVAVTGYMLTESPTAPTPGWSSTKPTSYTFTSAGAKTLYAWAKDAAGNVADAKSNYTTVTLPDTTPPSIIAVTPNGIITTTTATLTATTNEYATCKYDTTDKLYDLMVNPLDGSGATHRKEITGLTNGQKTYFVRCADLKGNKMTTSTRLQFTVQLLGVITECQQINVPGKYFLANDLVMKPEFVGAGMGCLSILSPDVVLDGNGKTLIGSQEGIGIFASKSNLLIKNFLSIKDFETGIKIDGYGANEIVNITIAHNKIELQPGYDSTLDGINIGETTNTSIIENEIKGSYGVGIKLAQSHTPSVIGNTVNGWTGILTEHVERPVFVDNDVTGYWGDGMYLTWTPFALLQENTLSVTSKVTIYESSGARMNKISFSNDAFLYTSGELDNVSIGTTDATVSLLENNVLISHLFTIGAIAGPSEPPKIKFVVQYENSGNIDEQTIKLYRYKESTQRWEEVSPVSIDRSHKWSIADGISVDRWNSGNTIYGVFGKTVATPSSIPPPQKLTIRSPPATITTKLSTSVVTVNKAVTLTATATNKNNIRLISITVDGSVKRICSFTTLAQTQTCDISYIFTRTGAHTYQVVMTDAKGQKETTTEQITVQDDSLIRGEDKTIPVVKITSPANGAHVTTQTMTLRGTSSDSVRVAKVEVKVNSGKWQQATGTTSWSTNVRLANGANRITVQATDASGNVKQATIVVSYTSTPAQIVTGKAVAANDLDLNNIVASLFFPSP